MWSWASVNLLICLNLTYATAMSVTHRFEGSIDLHVHIPALHDAWQSSGNSWKLVHAVKHCFKQILQVSLTDFLLLALLPQQDPGVHVGIGDPRCQVSAALHGHHHYGALTLVRQKKVGL